jgi:hypothetical protein
MPNPIERAVANADKITAANAGLERMSRPSSGRASTGSIGSRISGMKSGDRMKFGLNPEVEGTSYEVSYHDRPSYGDNNQPVPGATVGEYTVHHPDGRVTEHSHGPHANTDRARKMGANPNAKGYAADQAGKQISAGLSRAHMAAATGMGGVFNDKRG